MTIKIALKRTTTPIKLLNSLLLLLPQISCKGSNSSLQSQSLEKRRKEKKKSTYKSCTVQVIMSIRWESKSHSLSLSFYLSLSPIISLSQCALTFAHFDARLQLQLTTSALSFAVCINCMSVCCVCSFQSVSQSVSWTWADEIRRVSERERTLNTMELSWENITDTLSDKLTRRAWHQHTTWKQVKSLAKVSTRVKKEEKEEKNTQRRPYTGSLPGDLDHHHHHHHLLIFIFISYHHHHHHHQQVRKGKDEKRERKSKAAESRSKVKRQPENNREKKVLMLNSVPSVVQKMLAKKVNGKKNKR